jgi:hypothetical protein
LRVRLAGGDADARCGDLVRRDGIVKRRDRHGVFRVNSKDATSGEGKTEFGGVAERLAIARCQYSYASGLRD